MSTDLTVHTGNLDFAAQKDFAVSVTSLPEGANAARAMAQSMLPEPYRGNPANVLIAVGLGSAMGLSFAESLYRIAVIKGKPSASAELIASNVRRAGHKLRVSVTEDPPFAEATIIRADDPEAPITVKRDMAWAARMGLAAEANYKKQPATMLSYRAITACARLACPEALYGVTYTPDEIRDELPDTAAPAPVTLDRFDPPTVDIADAEEVTDEPMAVAVRALSTKTRARMFAMFSERGITDRDEQIRGIVPVIRRTIESRSELTEDEGRAVITALEALPVVVPADEPTDPNGGQ